ncbi:MAG: chemotaxis response regulator protein-glutamate methylesterase [Phycisphaerae bacterium]|nr:chemotaxis response regulator protein-glutamate methylesterase [Phycisphaerae bacterium]
MKIAIANSSDADCSLFKRLISSIPEYKTTWTTNRGDEITSACANNTPDLLLLDVAFSGKSGACIQSIMNNSPCTILLTANAVDGNEARIFEAMRWGALDVAVSPKSLKDNDSCREFLRKVSIMSKLAHLKTPAKPVCQATGIPLVAIGASTGGPNALTSILGDFPEHFEGCIIIVQHIDSEFVPGLAAWLDNHTKLTVQIALNGDKPEKGKVLVARGPDDLIITKDHTLRYIKPQLDTPYHPSINTFFDSCVTNLDVPGISILLSGMGKDGVSGMLSMKEANWETITQDEATSVIYGMPKMAATSGAAKHVLPLDKIAPAILEHTQSQLN